MRALTDLDEYVLECIRRDKTLLSNVSKLNYIQKLSYLVKVSGMSLLKFISNSKKSHRFIRDKWANNKSRQGYVSAILQSLRRCRRLSSRVPLQAINNWRMSCKELNEKIKDSYSKNLASPKQLAAFIPWPHVVARRQSLTKGSTESIFMGCYVDMVPLRNDFH